MARLSANGPGAELIVAGVGNDLSRDDAIGLRLLEAYGRQPPPAGVVTRVWADADALTLADNLLESDRPLLLVDCAAMGLEPGHWRLMRTGEITLACHGDALSTHGLGVAEALAIASELGRRSPVHLFGIQPFDTSPGAGLSAGMQRRFAPLLAALGEAVTDLLEQPAARPGAVA